MPPPSPRRLTACAALFLVALGLAAPALAAPTPVPVAGTKRADLLDYSSSPRPVVIGANAGDDTVIGSRYDDILSGGTGHDRITGGPGADLVSGDAGNDTVVLTPGGLPGTPAASGLNIEQVPGFSGQGADDGGEQDLVDLRPFGPGATLRFVRLGKLGTLTLPTVQIYEVRAAGASGGFVTITMRKGSTKLGSGDVVALPPAQENRAPVFATGDRTGSVTQASAPGGNRTDSGTIPYSDAEIEQTHSVSTAPIGTTAGTLTAQVAPDGNGIGTVTWTYTVGNEDLRPLGADDSPTESFSITLSDGTATTQATVVITKNGINDAPTATTTLGDRSVDALVPSSWTVPADLFTDPDGDVITRSAVANGTAALPGWLSFTDGTGLFAGTPAKSDAGTVIIDVIASDGTATATASFALTVNASNEAPVAVADTATWNVPHHSPTDPTSDEFSTNVLANDVDVDGDDLTASGGGTWKLDGDPLPAGTFTIAADGTLTMNSGTDPLGPVQQLRAGETWSATLSYTVSDGDDTSTGTVEVDVVGGRDQTVPFGRIAAPDDELVDFNDPTPTLFDARGCYVNPEGFFIQYLWGAQSSVTIPPDPAFIANRNVQVVSVPNNQWGFNSQASVQLTAIPSNGLPPLSQTVSFFVTDADGIPPVDRPTCGEQSGRPYAPDVRVDLGTASTGGDVLSGVIEPDGQAVTGGGYGYVGDQADPYGTYVVNANGSVSVTPDADNPLAAGESWTGEVRYRAIDPDGNVGIGMLALTVVG